MGQVFGFWVFNDGGGNNDNVGGEGWWKVEKGRDGGRKGGERRGERPFKARLF